MSPIISPRELAAAIGVSESSLKRWADHGQIRVSRTAGGHRRIAIGEAIRFVRAIRAPILRPELLGLRDLIPGGDVSLAANAPADRLFDLLVEGKARESRGFIMSLYMEGRSVAEIADGPIRAAMNRLGEFWKHDDAGVFIEHRATDICVQAIEQLRSFVEIDQPIAVAVGGAPPGDPYLLASMLVATSLNAEAWRAVNMGPDTPADAMLAAVRHHTPALVWLSVSSTQSQAAIGPFIDRLSAGLAETNTPLAIGGQGIPENFTTNATGVIHCRSISDLVSLARSLVSTPAANPPVH